MPGSRTAPGTSTDPASRGAPLFQAQGSGSRVEIKIKMKMKKFFHRLIL